MEGGSIFNFSFKLPLLSFLFAIVITIVIALFLSIVFGFLSGANYVLGSNDKIYAALGILYFVVAMYAPFDYIYTMGLDAAKA